MVNNEKTCIINIDSSDVQIITNGEICQYNNIQNVNKIGKVVNKDTNMELSQITPLIMLINQNSNNCIDKINKLLELGADPDMIINYYGSKLNAFDIIKKYSPKLVI